MKKAISLVAMLSALTACSNKGTNGSGFDGYGSNTLEEESLNQSYQTSQGVVSVENTSDENLLSAAPKYYIGSPYKVEDVQYNPVEDLNYNQTGIIGIIPSELNGTKTQNGEIFDSNQMVATSKVLPLPTIANITNLENGESVLVRINNRGPFVNSRIMDVSPAVARKLHFNGQTKAQIQVVAEKSLLVKNATVGVNDSVDIANGAIEPVYRESVKSAMGDYTVQVGAYSSEESARIVAKRMRNYGNAEVVNDGGMWKVRYIGLDASSARNLIDRLRNSESMSPGLIKNGRWINADSI